MRDTSLSATNAVDASIARARVLLVQDDGAVVVAVCNAKSAEHVCDILVNGVDHSLALAPDDEVLVWRSGQEGQRGVILGRIGASHAPVPDMLVLEAKHSLTLRVGEGSITIRDDGKILIKGKDLVSHAQRMNRIKGGAVSIN